MLILVMLQAKACNLTKSSTPLWVFFTLFKSYKCYGVMYKWLWNNGLVVKGLDSQPSGPVLKTTEWRQGHLVFHLSEVDKMSTRKFRELSGKK